MTTLADFVAEACPCLTSLDMQFTLGGALPQLLDGFDPETGPFIAHWDFEATVFEAVSSGADIPRLLSCIPVAGARRVSLWRNVDSSDGVNAAAVILSHFEERAQLEYPWGTSVPGEHEGKVVYAEVPHIEVVVN